MKHRQNHAYLYPEADRKQLARASAIDALRSHDAQYIWQDLQRNNRPIVIYKGLVDRLGCVKSALLLSQMIYWTRKGVNVVENHGWFFKTTDELSFETGMSRKEQQTAKRKLKALHLIDFKMAGCPAVPFYRLNLKGLTAFVAQSFEISAKSEVLSLNDIRSVQGQFELFLSKRLPYHTILANISGGVHTGLMLSFLFANLFNGYSQKIKGYVTKSIDEWQDQTGLTYKMQYKARERLLELGLIEERNFYLSREIYTRVNFKNCIVLFGDFADMRAKYVARNIHILSEKKGIPDVKKGVPSCDQRSNTAVTKGEILLSPNGEYCCDEKSNTAVTKGEIDIYKTTIHKTTVNQEYTEKPQPPCPTPTKPNDVVRSKVNDDVVVGDFDESEQLHYPPCLSDIDDQLVIIRKLKAVGVSVDVQTILDEMAGLEYGGNKINKPIRYFERLLNLSINSQFVPEVAHKVRKRREKQLIKPNIQPKPSDERIIVTGEERKQRLVNLMGVLRSRSN